MLYRHCTSKVYFALISDSLSSYFCFSLDLILLMGNRNNKLEKSRIFRYELPFDFFSKGQKQQQKEGGVQRPSALETQIFYDLFLDAQDLHSHTKAAGRHLIQ